MGIDPGITSAGFGVINCTYPPKLLGCGLLKVSSESRQERLQELYEEMQKLIHTWKPDVLAIEKLFFAKNTKTALAVAEARGAILLTASLAGLMVYEYTPLEIKKTVTGDGSADKLQLKKMVRLSLPGARDLEARDDAFDALAAAFTCYLKDVRGILPRA